MFKIGDTVKCIDCPDLYAIKRGSVYVVESVDRYENKIRLKGIDGGYYMRRFVKCDNNSPYQEWEIAMGGVM